MMAEEDTGERSAAFASEGSAIDHSLLQPEMK
jgi:hypothetical protein